MIDSERWLEIILLFFFLFLFCLLLLHLSVSLAAAWALNERERKDRGKNWRFFFWSKRCGTDTRKKNLGKRISERIAENMKWSVMNEINNDPVKGLGELWGKISKESPGLDRIFWKESSGKNLGGLSKNLEGEGGGRWWWWWGRRNSRSRRRSRRRRRWRRRRKASFEYWIEGWRPLATAI